MRHHLRADNNKSIESFHTDMCKRPTVLLYKHIKHASIN